jgi:dethiobiotin synthetase
MILIVTGTGTEVGKTVTTAAVAACATGSVAVVKLAQTGVAPGEPGDLAEISRLSGCTEVHEFARYPDPLSPHHAACISGLPSLDQGEAVTRISDLDNEHDLVLVEGAGGLLVPYTERARWTVLELADELDVSFLVVASAGLGTINHTTLTMNALEEAAVDVEGIVIGSWPAEPGLAELCNVFDLAQLAPRRELLGVLPAGMATMTDFPRQAHAALAPQLGGNFDSRAFRSAIKPRPRGAE